LVKGIVAVEGDDSNRFGPVSSSFLLNKLSSFSPDVQDIRRADRIKIGHGCMATAQIRATEKAWRNAMVSINSRRQILCDDKLGIRSYFMPESAILPATEAELQMDRNLSNLTFRLNWLGQSAW
jgi:hypothetical protein